MDVLYCQCLFYLIAASRIVATTAFDRPVTYTCDTSHQTISSIESYHDNFFEDRHFSFRCRDIPLDIGNAQASCYWTDYTNEYDETATFLCPGKEYVNGMSSIHDNLKEDRRWKFYCCSLPDVHIADCVRTSFTNEFDGDQNFNLPTGTVMKGMDSYHNNAREDRRYRFYVCKPLRDCH